MHHDYMLCVERETHNTQIASSFGRIANESEIRNEFGQIIIIKVVIGCGVFVFYFIFSFLHSFTLALFHSQSININRRHFPAIITIIISINFVRNYRDQMDWFELRS